MISGEAMWRLMPSDQNHSEPVFRCLYALLRHFTWPIGIRKGEHASGVAPWTLEVKARCKVGQWRWHRRDRGASMTKVQCHHNAKDSHTLPLQVGGELVCYLGAPFVTCTKCQDVSSDHVWARLFPWCHLFGTMLLLVHLGSAVMK